MSEWLDLMLEEIERKKKETREAREEAARRAGVPVDREDDADSAEVA